MQGDTSTAYGATVAAFHAKVRVAHVEAGLRTGDLSSPWPEEMYRQAITRKASRHFAPTRAAAANLLREGVRSPAILVTGNSAIDALLWAVEQLPEAAPGEPEAARRLILATGHRRENLDGGLERVCRALRELAERGDVQIVYSLHPNPAVQAPARILLAGCPAVRLVEPLPYGAFIGLMRRAYLIVSDSGGIQEEAPALGKPVLVTRDTTERSEAIEAGAAILTGTDVEAIVGAAVRLLDSPDAYAAMARPRHLFGAGDAAVRIADSLTGQGTHAATADVMAP